jgi:BON domain
MYRKFALFAATLSVFSFVLMGCPKAEEATTSATAAAGEKMGEAGDKMAAAGDKMAAAGDKMAAAGDKMAAAVTDPAKLMEALKADPGLAAVKIQANPKGELVMTGKVADQALKAKAEELVKAAGGTVKNAIIVGK